jgi:hypothetical protein
MSLSSLPATFQNVTKTNTQLDQKTIFDEQDAFNTQQPLQNATAVLVLGVTSLVICLFGIALAIIALTLAVRDIKLYKVNPKIYTIASYKNMQAGKICACISFALNMLLIVYNEFTR